MKVCTDACLFGAYVANELKEHKINCILDIGAGTGLLSLMLAQKTTAAIDSVEIDTAAFEQAKENILQSSYKERINIFNNDILQFEPNKLYDCILSNPPFFESDLKSADVNKNIAKHETSLSLTRLLQVMNKNLAVDGMAVVLLPYHRSEFFISEALKYNFYLSKKISVRQTPKHNSFRVILLFTRVNQPVHEDEIIIKNITGNYSNDFICLLKDYYLAL